jgi:hypothetical protein
MFDEAHWAHSGGSGRQLTQKNHPGDLELPRQLGILRLLVMKDQVCGHV